MGVPRLATDNIWELPINEKRTATITLQFNTAQTGNVTIESVYREDNPGASPLTTIAQIKALPTATGTFVLKPLIAGTQSVPFTLIIDAPLTLGTKRYYFVLLSNEFPEYNTAIFFGTVRVVALATVSVVSLTFT